MHLNYRWLVPLRIADLKTYPLMNSFPKRPLLEELRYYLRIFLSSEAQWSRISRGGKNKTGEMSPLCFRVSTNTENKKISSHLSLFCSFLPSLSLTSAHSHTSARASTQVRTHKQKHKRAQAHARKHTRARAHTHTRTHTQARTRPRGCSHAHTRISHSRPRTSRSRS